MKKYSLHLLIVFLSSLSVACKKEKSPDLEITVLNQDGAAVQDIWVRTSIEGVNRNRTSVYLDSTRTDAFGKAYFEYDNTILLDVKTYFNDRIVLDSVSLLLETKRLKPREENIYEETLIIEN